jgi:fatty-acyl-CoA synthase
VISGGVCVSYAELEVRTRRVAQAMRETGVRRGNRVGLLSDNRIEWLEVFFAAAALGAIVVPFSTWSTPRELDFLLGDAQLRLLFAIPRLGKRSFADDIAALQASEAHRDLESVVLLDPEARDGFSHY